MGALTGLSLLFAVSAIWLAARGISRLRHARWLAAGGYGGAATTLFASATALALAAGNLHTYQRLVFEQPVATLTFERSSAQRYSAVFARVGGSDRRFELTGDEWQLDARVLKWHGLANVLGLDASFRLQRLSARYRDLSQARSAPRSVFDLVEPSSVDIWALAERWPEWSALVDAVYGASVYLPMRDGARYRVSMGQSGLIARPDNAAARSALGGW